jgi:hypothetical protein
MFKNTGSGLKNKCRLYIETRLADWQKSLGYSFTNPLQACHTTEKVRTSAIEDSFAALLPFPSCFVFLSILLPATVPCSNSFLSLCSCLTPEMFLNSLFHPKLYPLPLLLCFPARLAFRFALFNFFLVFLFDLLFCYLPFFIFLFFSLTFSFLCLL